MPDYSSNLKYYQKIVTQKEQLDEDVLVPLSKTLRRGERVFYLSDENDYLSCYLSPKLGVASYNTGGDKELAVIQSTWPRAIRELRNMRDGNENAFQALHDGSISVLVLPYFNLRWHSYFWRPSEEMRNAERNKVLSVVNLNDPRFRVSESEWFAVVRLNKESRKNRG